ncbi:unnamed protein product [Onchocerca flexuosa]|uniref:Cullin domain-containing protein n=1 Tax=Onchocerca flexuosa TaxID=387005 RepID=A0A183HP35_9BILA|nr:unnamed protein product [Onchocerca flexuosa]
MERRYMEFVDIEEMELFMSRYMISSVSFDSILPDDFISIASECVKKRIKELSFTSEQSSSVLSAKCDGSKRSTLFNNFPCIAVYFTNDDASDALSPSLKSYLNLMHCLLSLSVPLRDSWSATRLHSKVCPKILPFYSVVLTNR